MTNPPFEPIRIQCPKCHGVGLTLDTSMDDYLRGPVEPPWRPCTRCMEAGFVPSRTHILDGGEVRKLTLLEKIWWGFRLYWPPDPEDPRYWPDPERVKYERAERDRKRRGVGAP